MTAVVKHERHPDLPPPSTAHGPIHWLRENLFSSPGNAAATVLGLLFLLWVIPPFIDWAILSASIGGTTREACADGGACWTFIKRRFPQFMFGRYPVEERWRIELAAVILIVAAVPLFLKNVQLKKLAAAFLLLVYPVIGFYLFHGGIFGLPVVDTNLWGGLFLTMVVALTGIVASLPLGVILALGRRSTMPAVRSFCIIFIEFWRGVPLITVLFMSWVMFPLFLPEGVNFNQLLRALIGVALFSAAYMAEVVRGGLQAIPRGQYEAAQAMGLGYWRMMYLVVLPQALKMVIPGIVNSFIALFKDTTLVGIIGLFDFLLTVQNGANDPNWLGYAIEGYVFAGAVYWAFCFGMSRYSMALERRLETGHKR